MNGPAFSTHKCTAHPQRQRARRRQQPRHRLRQPQRQQQDERKTMSSAAPANQTSQNQSPTEGQAPPQQTQQPLPEAKDEMLVDDDPLLIAQTLTYVTDDGSVAMSFQQAPFTFGEHKALAIFFECGGKCQLPDCPLTFLFVSCPF